MKRIREQIARQYGRCAVYSRKLDRFNRLPLLHRFAKENAAVPVFETRKAMWEHLNGLCDGPIDYLEFGVHEGFSILHWASINRASQSRFFGFDSFRGLPDTWNDRYPQGHFDVRGHQPNTSDSRITFIAGLFQDTLPRFLKTFVPFEQLVVHIDCDLYSSCLFCLTQLSSVLKPGTVLIFDEFGDVLHEFKAFHDFLDAYRRSYEVICSHDSFFTVALRLL